MGNINAINNKVPATSTQPFLVGNLNTAIGTGVVSVDSSTSANTTGMQTPRTLSAACSGTPAAGFGVAQHFQMHTSNNTMVTAAAMGAQWDTATNGAQTSSLRFYTTTSAAALAEVFRANNNGLSTNAGTDYFQFSTGSWTATIDTSNHDGTGTYTIQVARYVKIGKAVMFYANIAWSAHTGTGNMLVAGLPFTSDSTANLNWAISIWASSLTWAANTQLMGYVDNNATTIQLQYSSSGAAASAIGIDTAAQIIISGVYMSAS